MSDTLTYLVGNRGTKDAEGEFITVEDSYAVPPMNLSVDGKSTQVTTTGKNLLDHDVSNWLNVSGFSTVPALRNVWPIAAENGESFTYSRNSTGTLGMYLHWCNDPMDVSTYSDTIVTLTNRGNYTVTNSEGYAYLVMDGSTTITTATMDARQAQIEKGTSYTSYEPYSGGKASPRPDWPQEITSIDGISLKTCAKNFVPSDDPENPNVNYTFNSSKRVVWDSENEGFRLTDSGAGVAMTAHVSRNPRAVFIAPQDGIYTFGVDTKYYTSGSTYGFRAELNGTVLNGYGWGSPQQSSDTEGTRHSITRTLSKGDRFSAIIYSTCLWRNISVVEGTEDVYEPYSGTNVQSLLPDGYSLRSLPNGTKDELHLTYLRPSNRPGWAGYDRELVRRVDLMVLDGSESYGSEGGRYYIRQNSMMRLADYGNSILCDHLKVYSKQGDIGGTVVFVSGVSGYVRATSYYPNQNWIYIAIEKGMTAADTKQGVTDNPIAVQYPLATPVTTQLDSIELPVMQSGLTNIGSDPSTNLSITYECDKNIVITNLKAAVDDLATS